MKNYLKYFLFVIFLIGCVLSTLFYMKTLKNEEDTYFISEVLIYTKDCEYEVKTNLSNKQTLFRINDVEEVMYSYPREGKSRIPLPDLDTIVGKNVLVTKPTVMNYTYNFSYTESFQYLKFLIDLGYEIQMYASTPQYIELFLLKDSTYKRIIIFADTLMVCDMLEGCELPQVWQYLEVYNFNGYVEEKFNINFN